ncbi:adenylate/guanylate cyclase domain-containing protein [Leptolyngbya sp. FACHB-321]|uniref:adenylate/guanylate cyclase domain-containing protein n=1 Tax=Leptolyngbya sp. FACHB-321 TaxID=2692807 RepID=UPI0016865FA1|nr:adenylate/guanylate cyclase domain-containing protein [Leptolyngbya sp. FACHB-321]MBD2036635.1 adenylate/guanylate cyclase domain-containing protein [Leptolyngbya sp. FACHB-321]
MTDTNAKDDAMLRQTMYCYMTQELAEQLLANAEASKMESQVKEVSILYANICNYETLSESMEPEATVSLLNQYFETMVDAVFEHKGTLDKYIGAALMAVFGSPVLLDDHAWKAVETAVAMRDRLVHLNTQFASTNLPALQIGIGVNTARVGVGNISSSKRMEYTVVGDGVNLTVALERAAQEHQCDIILGEATYQYCADRIQVETLGSKLLSGRKQPITLYKLVGLS